MRRSVAPWFGMLIVGIFLGMIAPSVSADSSFAASASKCSYSQLEVAAAWGPGAAAGHIAVPFIIANTSHAACYLIGYPQLQISTARPNKHKFQVVRQNGSFMFARVAVRRIVLAPGRDASFGMSYVDALNQQYGNPPACMVQYINVILPIAGIAEVYQTTNIFNICFSGFSVVVTPIQQGPFPKLA